MPNTIKFTKESEKWFHKEFLLSFFTPTNMAMLDEETLKKKAQKTLKEISKLDETYRD